MLRLGGSVRGSIQKQIRSGLQKDQKNIYFNNIAEQKEMEHLGQKRR